MALLLSATHVEAHFSLDARTLVQRSIPSATALTSQTITFAALSGKTYGVAPFTVSATASSALPVSFASLTTPVCTVSGVTVTIVAAGTCTIQASQAGNATFAAAPNVSQSFAVAKATQSITFGLLSARVYGAAPFAVSATASSGLPVSFASTTTTVCTVSASTVTIVSAGICTVQASQAGNGNYNAAALVNQSLTVAKATQSITFGLLSARVYGAAPFVVSATATSALTVSFVSTTTAVCTVSTATVTIVAAGICTVQASQAGNGNYNAAPVVNQSFTVAKATQTITFGVLAAKVYGAAPFTVSATASSSLPVGFASTTTTVCTVSASTVTIIAAGTCTIQASQAGNGNYSAATAVNQSFTVAKATQTITFGALAGKVYGAAPFTVSATATSGLAVSFASTTTTVCTVSATTVTMVAPGTCTIQASQAGNANYSAATVVNQSFTVAKVSQTITFGVLAGKVYGAAPFTVSATAASGLAVSFSSVTTTVCTVSASTVTLVAAGTCTVRASQAGNATYAASANVDQSFMVTAAAPPITFAPAVNYATGSYPENMALGDFNGDGIPDLAVANALSASVSILIGHSDGTFTAGTTVLSGGSPEAVAVGDFNGDGKLDLAICDFASGTVVIFAGNGDGTFHLVSSFGSGLYPVAIAVADLNGDGKLDLVIANTTAGTTTGQTVSVLMGNGDGSFRAAVPYITGTTPYAVVVGDFDGDGKPDLAVANFGDNTVSVLKGNGDGTFAAAVPYATGYFPDGLAIGDFNGDGNADLAVVSDNANVSILLGHGDGTFGAATNFTTGSGSASVAVVDLNGDGRPDLAIVNRFDNNLVLLLGNGDGTFQLPQIYSVGASPSAVVARDLNGDGKPDLVVNSHVNNNISVLLQSGAVPATLSIQSGSPQSAAAGSAYATPLAVLVRDAGSNPVSGVPITFTAPASGASGVFSGSGAVAHAASNASGVATAPTFTANAITGSFSVIASVAALPATFALTNTAASSGAPAFSTGPPPNGTINVAYNFTVAASGTPAPAFSVVPNSLPTGLSLNGTSGLIAGTPSAQGTFAGMLTASNGVPPAATQAFAISIAGLAQTITFGALSNKPIGSAPFTVSATSSSGLAVSFASQAPAVCTVVGSQVTLVVAGTCTIRASQAGNATYAPAANVDQSFQVTTTLLSQTITFNALTNQVLGASPFALSATASSGLTVSFASLTTAVCTVNTSTVTLVAVGTCTIRAAQAGNATYSAAPNVDQSFLVAAAAALFAPQVQYATGSFPVFVVMGDFNGDGKLDAAVLNQSGSTVSIFIGNGDGTMQAATTLNGAGGFPAQAVVGDFNSDGNLDLAVTSILDGVVTLYPGNGDGTFRAPTKIAVGAAPFGIAAGDFNGDGKLDLVVTNGSSGTTVGQTIRVLLGNGDATFQPATVYTVGTNPMAVAVGDFNGDGRLDLAVANADSNTVSILLGNSNGTFGTPVNFATGFRPTSVAVGDVNGDGFLDLALTNSFGFSVLLGHGDGTFGASTSTTVGTGGASGIAIGDLNGDGKLDLAVANSFDNNVSVHLGNGSGGFQAPLFFTASSTPTGVATGSLRGNGNLDLVLAERTSNTISVLLNTSGARSPATLTVRAGTPQSAVIAGLFTTPLSVVARDAAGHSLSGVQVTFSAPASGASGTFAGSHPTARALTDVLGVATAPIFTANLAAGSYSVVATAASLSATFSLTNLAGTQAPVFTSSPPPAAQVGTAYSYRLTASGVPPPSFAVTTGALPTGLTLSSTTGVISGTPTTAGPFNGTATASNTVSPPATQAFSITVAQGIQSINFTAPNNQSWGGSPFVNLTASASSGLPVVFSSLTTSVCTVSGTTATMVNIGVCTIRASQTGNVNYVAAPNVDRSFNVSMTQTITFGALGNKTYTDPPFTVSATATSGLPVSFSSLTTPVCTVSGNTVTLIVAGTCTIRASQAGDAGHYQAPNVDQSFVVHASLLSQTISFAALSNEPFATWPFTISATASSGLPVIFASLTTGVCAAYGNTVTVIAMGTCTIRASQAGNADYAVAPNVDRSFSVTVANQTITFSAIGNQPLSALSIEARATASSGLSVSFASLTPTVCHLNNNFVTLLISGTCTIRASQTGNATYVAAPNVDQSFTVTPAYQTIVFLQPPDPQTLVIPQFLPQATASSGLPVTFSSLTSTVCTASGNGVTLVAAGICTIRATQAGNANYTAVSLDRSFTVGSYSFQPQPLPGPTIEYYTLLGNTPNEPGAGYDTAFDVVVGADGSAWVGGSVAGTSFPGLSSATFTNGGLDQLYVAKLNPNRGQIDLATVVGARSANITGTGQNAYVGADQVEAMAISTSGIVYVAAYADSIKYPLTGGTYARTGPKAIYRVAADGSVQAQGAVIDPAVQTIRALAVDSAGGIYFAGVAGAGLVTTSNAAIPSASAPAGGPYLIKLAPGGASIAYATYLSVHGSRPSTTPDPSKATIDTATTPYAIAVDAAGNAYLAGQAKANDFPATLGAPDTFDDSSRDAFVVKVNPTGTALLWVARIGGPDAERATSIALSPDGGVVIAGKSATYPLSFAQGGFQSVVPFLPNTPATLREIGFIAKLAADGSHWQFVLPIGTANGNLVGNEDVFDPSPCCDIVPVKIAVDATGAIYATGVTKSNRRLPVSGQIDQYGNFTAIQSPSYDPDAPAFSSGAFLMKITAGGWLWYSVIIGGGTPTGLALDAYGAVYIAGYGPSLRSPLVNSSQAAPGSAFIAKILNQSAPVMLTTTPNPGSAGQSVTLTGSAGDPRYAGSIEFRDGAQLLATVPVVSGTATFATTFAIGIHRLKATFHGSGPFDGAASTEVIQVTNQ